MKAKTDDQLETPQANKPTTTRVAQSRHGLLYVGLAVIFFATSPVFVRWSQPFNPIEIAFWRLTLAALLVALLGWLTHQPLLLRRQELPRFLGYGLITALHFCFYIAALTFTTIPHALAITYTAPIFVTLFSTIFLREPMTIRSTAGVIIALLGIAILTGFEPHYTACSLTGQCMFLGDGLALLSALCYGIYSIAGRGERDRHPLFRYTTNVYGLAALWLLPVMLLFAFRHAYPASAVGAVVALGILPLGLGHTLYNAAVRKVHATYANLIATQEVTIGVLFSAIFLHTLPTALEISGVLVTMLGIATVLL